MNPETKILDEVRVVLVETLGIRAGVGSLTEATPLFGSLPEFDSMSVVSLVTALETRFGISIADDEVSAELFETVASVVAFVERKRKG